MKRMLILFQRAQTWNCFNQLYKENIKKSYFEIIIAVCPFWLNENNVGEKITLGNYSTENKKVLESNGIHDYIDLEKLEPLERLKVIEELNVDVILTSTKDEYNYLLYFGIPTELFSKKFKVFYIPYYGATQVKNEDIHVRDAGHQNFYGFIVDNSNYKQYLINANVKGKDNIIDCGHPKIQEIYEIRKSNGKWPIKNNGEFKVIWAPHWSCPEFDSVMTGKNGLWQNNLKFGTFLQNYEKFYQFAKNNVSVQFVFRPHPQLQTWLRFNKAHKIFSDFFKSWEELPNTFSVLGGLYNDIFAASDLMITDGISFLIEYPIATNKPVIFIDSLVHDEFNEVGKLGEEYSTKVTSFDEVEHLLKNRSLLKTNDCTTMLNFLLPNRENTSNIILENLLLTI